MPKVISWECPRTGRLFALNQIAEYKKHLKNLAMHNRSKKKIKKEAVGLAIEFENAKRNINSLRDLSRFIEAQWKAFDRQRYDAQRHSSLNIRKITLTCIKCLPPDYITSLRGAAHDPGIKQLKHDDFKEYAKDGLLTGRISVDHNWAHINSFASVLEEMQIYTRNVGSYCGFFEISLADWTGIKADVDKQFVEHEKTNVIRALQGKRRSSFKYRNPKIIK